MMVQDDALHVELVRDGGHLSPGDRFVRLERALEDLQAKVGKKLDTGEAHELHAQIENRRQLITDEIKRDIERMNERLKAMESGDTMAGRMFLERFAAVEQGLLDIQHHGSSQAQEAQKELSIIETRVESLREENVRYNTLQNRRMDEQVARNRFWTIMIATINVAIVVANLIVLLATHK